MKNGVIIRFLKSTTGVPVPYYRDEAGCVTSDIKAAHVIYGRRSLLEKAYSSLIANGIVEFVTVTGENA